MHTRLASRAPLLAPVFCGLALLAGAPAHAQIDTPDELLLEPAGDHGVIRVGAGLLNRPAYQGSGDRVTRLVPVLNYRSSGGFFAGTTTGIGYDFSSTPGQQYGIRLSLAAARRENISPDLAGMGDVKAKPEIGGFLNMAVSSQVSLVYALRIGSGESGKGIGGIIGAAYRVPMEGGWSFNLNSHLSLASADLMQSYFGVTPAQSATSGYAVYTPRAGLRDWTTKATLSTRIGSRTLLTGGVSAAALLGDAADSPLTRQATSLSAFLAATYSF